MAQLTIVLHGERSPSQNFYYSSPHWSKRSKMAAAIHATVQRRLMAMGIEKGTTCNKRVSVEVVGYFDRYPLDPDNVCSKVYLDSLKGWLIEDDSPKYIDRVSTASRIDRTNPRVEIILTEVEE